MNASLEYSKSAKSINVEMLIFIDKCWVLLRLHKKEEIDIKQLCFVPSYKLPFYVFQRIF